MNPLSLEEYNHLLAVSNILEQDRYGAKVLQSPDGLIVKLFRRKRLLSSAILKPYALRFVENAKLIKKLGIATVEVQQVLYCKEIKRTLVFYRPLPGHTLGEVLHRLPHPNDLFEKFVIFYANLHNKGIFFRSIHLSNVIVSEDLNTLGLIDISDMSVHSKALSRAMRKRNFRHLTKYQADRESITLFGVDNFVKTYFSASSLPEAWKREFLAELQKLIEVR